MNRITPLLGGFFVAAGVDLAEPAHAIPLPIGTTIINFDFSSEVPPPPYSEVLTEFLLTGSGVFSSLNFYNDLNGVNLLFSSPNFAFNGALPISITGGPSAFMLDGQYSFGFNLVSGLVDLIAFTATADATSATPVTINGEVAAAAISEPSMDFLFVFGLAAFLVSRQRQKRPDFR